jgi:hypothetical protein
LPEQLTQVPFAKYVFVGQFKHEDPSKEQIVQLELQAMHEVLVLPEGFT